MSTDRDTLKSAALALLDAIATEHPIKHQASKAGRYVVLVPGGGPVEVMFQKDPTSPANLWIHAKAAGHLAGGAIPQSPSPASKLRTERGKDGVILYGRHSGLEKLPQLGEADLICFTPTSLQELGAIIDQVLAASASGMAL